MKIVVGKDYIVREGANKYHFFEPQSIVRATKLFINGVDYLCTGKSKINGRSIEQVIRKVDLEEIPSEDYSTEGKTMKELELGKLYKIDSVDKKDKSHCFADGTIVVTLRKQGKSIPNYWECARLYRFCNESVRQTICQDDLIELTEEDYKDLSTIINEEAPDASSISRL